MFNTLKNLFDQLTQTNPSAKPADIEHQLQLASAVLLVDVMRADAAAGPLERAAVVGALRTRFGLSDGELAGLMELSEPTAQNAYDYHQFTSHLNDHCTHDQKVILIENMWLVAYADAHLDAHENHLISKIAGLLHVTHGQYIAAKLRARAQLSNSPVGFGVGSGLAFDQAVDHQQDDRADH